MRGAARNACRWLSLVLCLAVIGLWVASYRGHRGKGGDRFRPHAHSGHDWLFFGSLDGRMWLECDSESPRRVAGPNWRDRPALAMWEAQFPPPVEWGRGDFGFRDGPFFVTDPHGTVWMNGWRRGVAVPHWAVVALLAVLPVQGRGRRLTRRAVAGRCHTCGYDLRATPQRCPECGTVPRGVGGGSP